MTITRQVSHTLIAKVISFGFLFVGNVFLTRLLGVEGKGLYAFILINVGLFAIIFGFNITETLTYFVARKDFDQASARGFTLLINGLGVLLFGGILLSLYAADSTLLSFLLPEGYQTPFYLILIFIIFINVLSEKFFRGNWQGNADFKTINVIALITGLMSAVIYFTLWLLQSVGTIELSLETIFIIILMVTIVFFFVRLIPFLLQKNSISFQIQKVAKPLLLFSGIGWITILMNFGVKRLDFWFIEYFNGIRQLGLYALASSVVDTFVVVLLPATSVISPYITKAVREERERILGRFSRIAIAGIIIFGIIGFPFIRPLLPLVYGMEFLDSVAPMQVLFLGIIMLLIRNIFTIFNIATDNLRDNFYGILLAFLLTLVLDLILIPRYGIVGASWASFIAYSASAVFIISMVLRKMNHTAGYFLVANKGDVDFVRRKWKTVF